MSTSINTTKRLTPREESLGWWERSLTRWVWWLVAGWTLVTVCLLVIDLWGNHQRQLIEARATADASWARDMAYRRWVQMAGGVYVPISPLSPPNEQLAHVVDRDITTPSGKKLTLVNSSYMFRQVAEMAAQKTAVSRTTSLKPLRPENSPGPSEAEALRRFAAGEREAISWIEDSDDRRYLQIMRPFLVEEPCMKCHAAQGYSVGDVRGGITTTVSIPTPWEEVVAAQWPVLRYGILWVAGLAGIAGTSRSLRKAGQRQQQIAEAKAFSNAIVQTQFEASPEGVLVVGLTENIVSVNRRYMDMWGLSATMLESGRDRPVLAHIAGKVQDTAHFQEKVNYLYEHTQEKSRDELVLKDGRIFDCYSAPLTLPDGRYVGRTWFFRDITERKRTEVQLRESEEKYRAIFAAESDGIFVVDVESGTIIDCNNAITAIYGYPREELIGQSNLLVSAEPQATRMTTLTSPQRIPLRLHRKKDGTTFPVEITTTTLSLQGKMVHVAAVRDITQRKAMEDELRTAALTDRLTGLPNRTLLLDRLQHVMERHRRSQTPYAVLFLDLDRFKMINDSLGHKAGDELLSTVAQRLVTALRSGDSISRQTTDMAARLGGDEFVILLEDMRSQADAQEVAERLLTVLGEPYAIGEHEIISTASIGIVTSACGHDCAEDVLRDADTAMYEAKMGGRGRAMVFDGAMRGRVQQKMELEHGIRKGLETGQFLLHYQPIVSLENGSLESLEVLARWQHPRHGFISPGEFIPVAEETGLIVPLGEWVFREACVQLARWWRTLGRTAVPSLSINLSRHQLSLTGLAERLYRIVQEAGVETAAIHLEVTESAIMTDAKYGADLLLRLRNMGFKIDIDDFGTGYSSLSCLHEFPINVLKIDRSFVSNLNRGRDFGALVNAIATLAGNLGIKVVAEGVETAAQVAMLQSLECQFAQGYYFARPMPADEVQTYLLKAPTPVAAATV